MSTFDRELYSRVVKEEFMHHYLAGDLKITRFLNCDNISINDKHLFSIMFEVNIYNDSMFIDGKFTSVIIGDNVYHIGSDDHFKEVIKGIAEGEVGSC